MIISFDSFLSLLKPIWLFLGDFRFLLFAVTTSLIIKSIFLSLLIKQGAFKFKNIVPQLLLLFVIIGAMVEDVAWIVKLTKIIFYPQLDYRFMSAIVRISWAFLLVRYQALALFVEGLSEKKIRIRLHQLPFLLVSIISFASFLFFMFYNFNCTSSAMVTPLELGIFEFVSFYCPLPLIGTSILIALWRLRSPEIPKLIKKQLRILIQFLVVPAALADIIQSYPFKFFPEYVAHTYSVVGISTIAMSFGIYYSARKIMGLRFLNLRRHVAGTNESAFLNEFKGVVEQFAAVTSERELAHITQTFFKDVFAVPIKHTHLFICGLKSAQKTLLPFGSPQEQGAIEAFINAQGNALAQNKIFITNEIVFNNFYKEDEHLKKAVSFLQALHIDLFLPVYDKESLVGYIIVEEHKRNKTKHEFFTNVERDQMIIFTTHLGSVIHMLGNKNMSTLIAQEKELREELYRKHQKINQYQESIRSFFHNKKDVGIIFYKNRRFTFGNQAAQELVQVNVNTHVGHPISKALKKISLQALEYRTQQTSTTQDFQGGKLILNAIPSIETSKIIISIRRPEISDVLKKKSELLNNPTKWDYLLYLETTKSGKLIDELIPGCGETILNFKIDLLKAALCKKAILLDMPNEDLLPTVKLLHDISLRDTLHTLNLHGPIEGMETAIKLFGANPLLGFKTTEKKPLLEKLNKTGTLFIQNIHFLERETQESLAQFIRYGFYKAVKSDTKITSDVRIICSTDRDLKAMMQKGTFSEMLFCELSKTTLVMPSLITLPEEDLQELVVEFSQQKNKDGLQTILRIADRETKKILKTKPASLQELRKRVQRLLEKKMQENNLHQESHIMPACEAELNDLAEIALLGRHALKDRKIMGQLWTRLKSQNKIASLLGVNRSSVNRRCKEYGLE